MHFLITWQIDQDQWLAVLKTWTSMTPQERANAGEGVRIVGRWHDLAARTGVLIVEAEEIAAVQRYLGQWNPYMNLTIAPVLDDEASAVVARHILAANPG